MLGVVPGCVATGADRRPVGEFDRDVVKPEIAVNRKQELAKRDLLIGDLALGAEDMRVVLGEGTHPHNTVQCA